MDAISPEYCLGPNGEGGQCVPAEWDVSIDPPLMFHRPTRLLFEIYHDAAVADRKPKLMELRARLNHVCNGHSEPHGDLTEVIASVVR